MSSIPAFTDTETGSVRSTLDERWGKDLIEQHLVDVEARLSPADIESGECPAVYREQEKCHCVIKTDASR